MPLRHSRACTDVDGRNAALQRRACGAMIESLESRLLLSTYTVTSLADDGSAGTLRWAIDQANTQPGSVIRFDATIFAPGAPQ